MHSNYGTELGRGAAGAPRAPRPGDVIRKHVLVNGHMTGCWATGTVTAVHADGRVDIEYANGEMDQRVLQDTLELLVHRSRECRHRTPSMRLQPDWRYHPPIMDGSNGTEHAALRQY